MFLKVHVKMTYEYILYVNFVRNCSLKRVIHIHCMLGNFFLLCFERNFYILKLIFW